MRQARYGTWVLALAAAVLVAGCTNGDGDDANVIRVVRNVGPREGFRLHWEAWKAAFERDNPGWRMELVDVGDDIASKYYQPRIATGDLPEVIQTWSLTKLLADNGHLLPVPDEYYTKFGMPLPDAYKGKRYATMGSVQLQGIAVNMRMWRDIGVTEPPETWEAFVAALKKLDARGHKAMTYSAKDWSAVMPLTYGLTTNLYAYRGRTIGAGESWTRRKDAGSVSFATDGVARKVMQNLVDLLDNFAGRGALSDGYSEGKGEFFDGKSATWLMGCWIGGDLEPKQVDLEIEYWPIPSMTGRKPIFLTGSYVQTGWAATTSATGDKKAKSLAVLEALYDPKVYQAWLNAEGMIASATRVRGVVGPKSGWPAARRFYDSMIANHARYGHSRGDRIAMDDMAPVTMATAMKQLMQEILAGERDVDKLLAALDKAWATARKSE